MRERGKILGNLETLYREAFETAQTAEDEAEMGRLDFGYQRDQLVLEVLLDLRDLLSATGSPEAEGASALLEKAEALRRITRLR